MSIIKKFLADEDNLTVECLHGKRHADPEIRKLMADMDMRDRLACADGFTMSVQYSRYHYCNGREKFFGGDRESRHDPLPEPRSVEVGFPSEAEPLLAEYAEEPTRAKWVDYSVLYCGDEEWHRMPPFTRLYRDLYYGDRLERWIARKLWPQVCNLPETVYGWVPVEVVDAVIEKHGGLRETPKGD